MTKNQLRVLFKNKRNAISETEKLRLDDLLLIQFQQFDFSNIQSLFTYWPMENHSEPNVELMARFLRLMIPAIQIAYPVTDISDFSMKAILADEDTDFNTNEWGLREPLGIIEISCQNLDLIFIPLLAYDKKGYRVGFGKGFYDRYLANCKTGIVKIGFSYFEPIDQISDTNQFDVPLNYCITPQHIYEF
jgi:5-formyltetrahydrofolate cyclo-ligase